MSRTPGSPHSGLSAYCKGNGAITPRAPMRDWKDAPGGMRHCKGLVEPCAFMPMVMSLIALAGVLVHILTFVLFVNSMKGPLPTSGSYSWWDSCRYWRTA